MALPHPSQQEEFYNIEDTPHTSEISNTSEADAKTNNTTVKASSDIGPEPMAMMLRVLTRPNDGWRAYKSCRFTPAEVERRCFYPLVALAALSSFFNKIYSPDTELQTMLVDALVVFMSFFFGYFIVMLLCRIFFNEESRSKIESNFGRCYVLMGLSVQALITVLQQGLQMIEPVLAFLPLLTIYILSKGVKFLRVPKQNETLTTALTALFVVGVPMLLHWLFQLILPSQI